MKSKGSKQWTIQRFLTPIRSDSRVTPKACVERPKEKKEQEQEQKQEQEKAKKGKRFSVMALLEDPSCSSSPLPLPHYEATGACSGVGGSDGDLVSLLEVVWAKYSRYPPWPAIVCFDAATDLFKTDSSVHVQFFDRISSRAWVARDGLRRATEESLRKEEEEGPSTKAGKWRKELLLGMKRAIEVMGMGPAGRQEVVREALEKRADAEVEEESEWESEEDEDDEDDEEYYCEESPKKKKKKRKVTNSWVGAKKAPAKKKRKTTACDREEGKASPPPLEEELSEYELIRQRNIESRMRLFRELNISGSKDRLSESFGSAQKENRRPVSRRGLAAAAAKKAGPEEQQPVRKSLRLQNMAADLSASLPVKEPTVYIEDEHPRMPLETLELADVVSEKDCLKDKENFLTSVAGAIAEGRKAGEKRASFGEDVEASMGKLTISERCVAKVVPDRIFSLAVHPTESKHLIAAGGKWGGVGLWDVDDVHSDSHGVNLFMPHSRPVNCLTFGRHDKNKLFSTSYDGTVRCLDLATGKVALVFGDEADEVFTAYHHQLDEGVFVVALGSSGRVGIVDCRESNASFARLLQAYQRPASVKTVDVHPVRRDILLCSNSKGGCHTFDLRRGGKSQMTPLTELTGHTKAISSAFFCPVGGNVVNTVCYDNKIRLYDINQTGAEIRPSWSVAHNNQTGRWLTTFKTEWHPRRDDLFFVGSMQHPRQIEAFSAKGEMVATLKGNYLASVCSIVKCHPSLDVVVGGNSSGRVHVFL